MPKIPQKDTTPTPLMPFWQTTDGSTVRLYSGDVCSVLDRMPANSIHCVVTSPPYWGLRDYGTGQWEGGSKDCDHQKPVIDLPKDRTSTLMSRATNQNHEREPWKNGVCGKCGAKRIDKQIGSEPSPDCGTQGKRQCGRCFVCTMVKVFTSVRRVLRYDGSLWLNLGDTYGDGGQLMGMPWRVALALQANGWILRSDVPWVKRNPMPESCTDRPAKALEYVFLLVKQMGYFYDGEAIKPKATPGVYVTTEKSGSSYQAKGMGRKHSGNGVPGTVWTTGDTRNFRNADLWFQSISSPHGLTGVGDELVGLDVTTQGYPGSHFATFPVKLITPLIKASTSEKGCCVKCGKQWVREIEKVSDVDNEVIKTDKAMNGVPGLAKGTSHDRVRRLDGKNYTHINKATNRFRPDCTCNGRLIRKTVTVQDEEQEQWVYESSIPLDEHEVQPATVLDPFIGSATTCAVCIELGRYSVGIDLNEKYLTNNAIVRVQGALLSRPAMSHLAGIKRVNVLTKNKQVQ